MPKENTGRKRRLEEVEASLQLTFAEKIQLREIKKGNGRGDWRRLSDSVFKKHPEMKNRTFEELFFKSKKTYIIRCGESDCFTKYGDTWFSSYNGCHYAKREFRQHVQERHNVNVVSIRDTLLGSVQFKNQHVEDIRDSFSRFIATSRCALQVFESILLLTQ